MKPGILVSALAAMAVVFIPQAGGQNNNSAPGTIVGWGQNLLPYIAPGTQFTMIAAGWDHILALNSDGMVVAWGDNIAGECTVPANLTNVLAIAAGGHHSLALNSDGTLVAGEIIIMARAQCQRT
jgi:hypothetical protein